jgi:uncharacterized protein (DUF2225 family)
MGAYQLVSLFWKKAISGAICGAITYEREQVKSGSPRIDRFHLSAAEQLALIQQTSKHSTPT